MGLLLLLIIGFLAGLIASAIMHTAYPWYVDVILGIVGAWLGGWIFSLLGIGTCSTGIYETCYSWLYQLIAGIIGAIIVIAVVHLIERKPMRY